MDSRLDFEDEKNAVDFVTDAMFSLDFLKSISDVIFSKESKGVTVVQFYEAWLKNIDAKDIKVPFNLGAILGYLYCGLLFTKEHWFELLPKEKLTSVNASWGISGVSCEAPLNNTPDLRYVVRRMRNALGHGRIRVNVPENIKDKSQLMTSVTVTFNDVNEHNSKDTFKIEVTLEQLATFIRSFQATIHQHVLSKIK
jgi:hypothetical protein